MGILKSDSLRCKDFEFHLSLATGKVVSCCDVPLAALPSALADPELGRDDGSGAVGVGTLAAEAPGIVVRDRNSFRKYLCPNYTLWGRVPRGGGDGRDVHLLGMPPEGLGWE